MTIHYSPSTRGFYTDELDYPALPDDLVDVTDDYEALHYGQATGDKEILVVDGRATLVARVYTPSWDDIRARRDKLLRMSDFTQSADWPGDKAAWMVYRKALRDVPETFASPESVQWPPAPPNS